MAHFLTKRCYAAIRLKIQNHSLTTNDQNLAHVNDIEEITQALRKFRDERDWAQFHNAKDLALALNIEAGELLETFLWKSPEQADVDSIKEELADVFTFALLLAEQSIAFDIGTGTGVLAAALALRGIQRIVATDMDSRALACARDNLTRLNLIHQVELVQTDLFPAGQAALIVCNPPWIAARPSSPLEHAIFDPESRMLRRFLHGLSTHLLPGGEGWLILSDLAEHLGLRTREQLLQMIDAGGLNVLSRIDTKPHHPRVSDVNDLLHAARAAESTSLWRLAVK